MRRGVAHGNANGTRIGRRLDGIEPIETGVVPGLSYTTFKYSAFVSPSSVEACDSFAVTVDVTNTGAVAGDEVVQLYATTPGTHPKPFNSTPMAVNSISSGSPQVRPHGAYVW